MGFKVLQTVKLECDCECGRDLIIKIWAPAPVCAIQQSAAPVKYIPAPALGIPRDDTGDWVIENNGDVLCPDCKD